MILVIYFLGDLIQASSVPCYNGCFCYSDTINCSKLSLTAPPIIPENVGSLDLTYNCITEAPLEETFQYLKYLNLSHNKLKSIHLDLRNSFLEGLKLSGNPLKEVHINSTALRILDLSYCDISHLQPDFLYMLPSLEILDVSYNPLKVIHPLHGNLIELYLQGCLFRRILFKLPKLEILDISFNRYMTILKIESNLTILRATHSSIYQLELELPHLRVLEVAHNRLSQVYLNNPSLEELDLSWNSIRSLQLIGSTLLKLDLSHNLLQELELTIDNLSFLNISFNPLSILKIYSAPLTVVDCASCQLRHINLPPVHTLNLSRNGLDGFVGEATYLDLSHNFLDTFKENAKFVDLRGNRLSLPKKVTIKESALLGNNPWLCKCEDNAMKELYLRALDNVTCASPEGKSWDACYTTKLPKYMKDYPWIPLVASSVLTLVVVIAIYMMKHKLWADGSTTSQNLSRDIQEISTLTPYRARIDDRLPSYEEALLMNKPTYSSRSYEIVPNRRLSSSSI